MKARWQCAWLLVGGVLLASCGPKSESAAAAKASASNPSLVISQVRLDRDRIDPAKHEVAAVRFNLNEPANITLSVFDGRDHRVYQASEEAAAGDQTISWNGQDASGKPVPPEAYSYTLTAKNAKGQTVHDLTDLTGGVLLAAKDVRWDAAEGKLHYYLDKPARVNLRFGLQDGPYLRTVVDWVPRGAGANAETWDGMDASGVLKLGTHPAVQPVVKAYTLPDNTIFVGANADQIRFVADDAAALRERTTPKPAKEMFNLAQQPLDTRGDVTAKLTLGGHVRQDKEGRWIVSGKLPLKADVADAQRQRVIERRFEASFYIDGVFSHENELGYVPLTWTWDSSQVNNGEHFVTLNIRGYEGNFGTATVKVMVDNASVDNSASSTSASAAQTPPGTP
jgi:FlgD Ig-like domain